MRRHKYYYDLLLRQLKFLIPEGSSVLDVGFHDGSLLAGLKPSRGLGISSDKEGVERARRRFSKLEFVRASVKSFKSDEKFDYIILVNSIGSVPDIQLSFEGLRKNCHRDTRVIILHYSFLWHPGLMLSERLGLKRVERIRNWVSAVDVSNFLELAGFDVVQQSKKILLPVWFPLLSNLVNKYVANLPLVNVLNLMHVTVARLPMVLPPEAQTCSIVIPTRNEAGNIEAAVKRTPELGTNTEIIFIEGGSKDNTWAEIQRVAKVYEGQRTIRFAKQDGRGKGDAVRKGFAMAKNNVLFILDADLTVAPEEMPKFFNVIASGKGEFVNGSRLVYPMEEKAMRPINLFGNKMFSLIFTFLLGQRFKDTLCGTKVLTRKNYDMVAKGRKYFGDFDPFGDFDLIFGAAKLGLKIVEMPIHYKQRVYGDTNIQRWKHGAILLRMCAFAMRKIKFV